MTVILTSFSLAWICSICIPWGRGSNGLLSITTSFLCQNSRTSSSGEQCIISSPSPINLSSSCFTKVGHEPHHALTQAACHICTVLSVLLEAMSCPLGDQRAVQTVPVWLRYTKSWSPVAASQTCTVVSAPPEMMRFPSLDQSTVHTLLV